MGGIPNLWEGFKMGYFRKGLFFAPDDGGGSGDGDAGEDGENNQEQDQQEAVLEWDTFHKALPVEAQKLISDRESGLKSSLSTERDARKGLEKDLKAVAKDLKDGSEAQEKVLKLADEVAAGTLKADFYEDAHEKGVVNLKLAYHIVEKDDLFDSRGNVDFKALKEDYPELFVKSKPPPADGGEGTGSRLPSSKVSMNDLIRAKAGRK